MKPWILPKVIEILDGPKDTSLLAQGCQSFAMLLYSVRMARVALPYVSPVEGHYNCEQIRLLRSVDRLWQSVNNVGPQ